jgi:hypothetical protein
MTDQQPPYAPQQGYPPVATSPGTNGLAIASFVLALFGFGIIPIVLGHIAVRQIRDTGQGGQVFAVIGLVLGYVTTITVILALIVAAIVVLVTVNSP